MKHTKIKQLPKLHLACSDDSFREVLQYIYIDERFAVASDANVLISFDLTGFVKEDVLTALNGCIIHKSLWKTLCEKDVQILSAENGILKYQRNIVFETLVFEIALRKDLTFYEYKKILPTEIKDVPAIGFNMYLVDKIRRASGMNVVKFTFNGDNKGALITPLEQDDLGKTFALLMPVLLSAYA